MTRQCGGCTLCCKLIPVDLPSGKKLAGHRCPHQRTGKGCAIYNTAPFPCRMWNCRWLVNDDTAELRRPDRVHYVVDITPDHITIVPNEGGERTHVQVVQIWVDPDYPDAWRDPALLAYLDRRGQEGIAALIRWGSSEGMTLFPPSMSSDGEFHECRSNLSGPEHSLAETARAVATAPLVKLAVE